MQQDVPDDVVIIGVNEAGFDGGNEGFCDGRDLPWLQDTDADSGSADVWTQWDVTYRDVVLVDREGRFHTVFNLTDNNLSDDANYWGLVTALEDLAGQ